MASTLIGQVMCMTIDVASTLIGMYLFGHDSRAIDLGLFVGVFYDGDAFWVRVWVFFQCGDAFWVGVWVFFHGGDAFWVGVLVWVCGHDGHHG